MTPTRRGNLTEALLLAALVAAGYDVLLPVGDGHRYDLAIRGPEGFRAVQVKTGRLRNGCVEFHTADRTRGSGRGYAPHADLFGVCCRDDGRCYLVPVADVPVGIAFLRVEPPRSPQQKGVRWARDYLLRSDVAREAPAPYVA